MSFTFPEDRMFHGIGLNYARFKLINGLHIEADTYGEKMKLRYLYHDYPNDPGIIRDVIKTLDFKTLKSDTKTTDAIE